MYSDRFTPLNGRLFGDSLGQYTSFQPLGSSVIDYFIVSESLMPYINFFKVHEYDGNMSDHCKISMMLSVNCFINVTNSSLRSFLNRYIWTEDSCSKFQEALVSENVKKLITLFENEHPVVSDIGINNMVDSFNQIVYEAADMVLKKKRNKKSVNIRSRPHKKAKWYDQSLIVAKRQLNYKLVLFKKFHNDPYIRSAYFSALKHFRKLRKFKFRKYKHDLIAKLDSLCDKNPKEYWKLLEEICITCNKSQTRTVGSVSSCDWLHHFEQLNSNTIHDTRLDAQLENLEKEKIFSKLDYTISSSEICKAIQGLKSNKASGFDIIINEMLKTGQQQLHGPLLKLFNTVFSSGIYPAQWSQGYINPIYKKGSRDDPSNYRGITINSCVGKLFTKILNMRLENFLYENKIIHDEQIGFTKDKRTTDHMFVLKTLVEKHTTKGSKPLYTCFVDFKGAFDSVWHTGLFYKLRKIGISDKFYSIIKNMYLKTELCVKADSALTDSFHSSIGVRQGDNLSPNLFKIFVNDFQNTLDTACDPVLLNETPLSCLFYADDLVLMSSSQTGLQTALNKLNTFCNEWKLSINFSKTKCLAFNPSGRILPVRFEINGCCIENVKNYCYLGVNFSTSGTFSYAKREIYNKGLKAYFKFIRCFSDSKPNVSTFLHIFDHTVKSVLLYGSEIWGSFSPSKLNSPLAFYKLCNDSIIEKLNVKACKFALGVNRKSTNAAVMSEVGRFPLFFNVFLNMVKFWVRLEKSNNQLLREALVLSKKLHDNGHSSWISCIFSLLKFLDLTPHYILNSKINMKKVIFKKLSMVFSRCWKEELFRDTRKNVNQKNKLRTFRLFKNNFKFETYLSIGSFAQRISLCKFRIGDHQLEIELGRHKHQSECERICKLCNENVEDEIHFLLSCPKLESVRAPFIKKIVTFCPNLMNCSLTEKFIWIMGCEDSGVITLLSDLIKSLFSLRDTLLNCSS